VTQASKTSLEFSRPVRVALPSSGDREVHVAANRDECDALAGRFGLDRLERLDADITVTRRRNGAVRITGTIRAGYTQRCVVSLDQFDTTLEYAIERRFVPEPRPVDGQGAARRREVEIDPLADDPPDTYRDDHIDLGVMIAEELGVNIDPHPRKPGAEFALDRTGEPASEADDLQADPNPFAVLKATEPDR